MLSPTLRSPTQTPTPTPTPTLRSPTPTPTPGDVDAAFPPERRTLMWRWLQALCRVVSSVLFDLKVYGIEHVPKTGGVLLVTNHQSYLDPVLLAVRLQRPVSFLAKSELFINPFFGWFIRQLNAFPVRQGARQTAPMKESIRLLSSGRVLNIFPEGERSFDGRLLPSQPGVGLVIRRAKVPVVPIVIDRAYRAWPKGYAVFHYHPVRVLIGAPMTLHASDGREICRQIDRALASMMLRLRGDNGSEPNQ